MKITFLGTASGKPSKHRNVTSIAIELDDSKYILIDCGEGTQNQILKSELKFNNLLAIYITHLHGDHIFGLQGLLATINEYRKDDLNIYGPIGIKKYIESTICSPYCNVDEYNILVHESNDIYMRLNEIKFKQNRYIFECCFVTHREFCYAYKITKKQNNPKIDINKLKPILDKYSDEIKLLGYSPITKIINKMKEVKQIKLSDIELNINDYAFELNNDSIVICLDNCDASNMAMYFISSNILIHECTYAVTDDYEINELEQKAILHGHSTNRMAASNALQLNCNHLILTHFSNRYDFKDAKMKDEKQIIDDTNKYFNKDIYCAYDLISFDL